MKKVKGNPSGRIRRRTVLFQEKGLLGESRGKKIVKKMERFPKCSSFKNRDLILGTTFTDQNLTNGGFSHIIQENWSYKLPFGVNRSNSRKNKQ